jgi:hypothetical protein
VSFDGRLEAVTAAVSAMQRTYRAVLTDRLRPPYP